MSSADRAGEMAEQRAAMKKQFAAEGKILSYNDSKKEKQRFYKQFSRTKAKHDFVEMATGTQATSDTETRGFWARDGVMSHVAETAEEQKLAREISGLRKGKFDDKTTSRSYLKEPAVGEPTKKKTKVRDWEEKKSKLTIAVDHKKPRVEDAPGEDATHSPGEDPQRNSERLTP